MFKTVTSKSKEIQIATEEIWIATALSYSECPIQVEHII